MALSANNPFNENAKQPKKMTYDPKTGRWTNGEPASHGPSAQRGQHPPGPRAPSEQSKQRRGKNRKNQQFNATLHEHRVAMESTFDDRPGCFAVILSEKNEEQAMFGFLKSLMKDGADKHDVMRNNNRTHFHYRVTNLRAAKQTVEGLGFDRSRFHHCVANTCCNNRRNEVTIRVFARTTDTRAHLEASIDGQVRRLRDGQTTVPMKLDLADFNVGRPAELQATDVIELKTSKHLLQSVAQSHNDILSVAFRKTFLRTFINAEGVEERVRQCATAFGSERPAVTSRSNKLAVTVDNTERNKKLIDELHEVLRKDDIEKEAGYTSSISLFVPTWYRCSVCSKVTEPHSHNETWIEALKQHSATNRRSNKRRNRMHDENDGAPDADRLRRDANAGSSSSDDAERTGEQREAKDDDEKASNGPTDRPTVSKRADAAPLFGTLSAKRKTGENDSAPDAGRLRRDANTDSLSSDAEDDDAKRSKAPADRPPAAGHDGATPTPSAPERESAAVVRRRKRSSSAREANELLQHMAQRIVESLSGSEQAGSSTNTTPTASPVRKRPNIGPSAHGGANRILFIPGAVDNLQ